MELIEFIKCSNCRITKNCCCEKTTMERNNERDEDKNEDFVFPYSENKVNAQNFTRTERTPIATFQNHCFDDSPKVSLSWPANRKSSMYQPSSDLWYNVNQQPECFQAETFSTLDIGEDKNFRCPRCGKRMQEPRLLPCLHPMCSPCVSELMSKHPTTSIKNGIRDSQQREQASNFYETCPLCDFELPNSNSCVPPPHYPFQHRLVMDAIRCRLANRVLCDNCPDEIIAVVQCSTCLRNFCSDCGMHHEQQVTMGLKPSQHLIKPIWEATKVRRISLCQKHPTHALRFYCIACQQVTCKECMWSIQHRGHATESAASAGKRAALYLSTVLQRAKILLNTLLTQYDRDAFIDNDEWQEMIVASDYRYSNTRIPVFFLYIQ